MNNDESTKIVAMAAAYKEIIESKDRLIAELRKDIQNRSAAEHNLHVALTRWENFAFDAGWRR